MLGREIIVFTDGSCHTQLLTGAWAAIVFVDAERHVLSGIEQHTTHNRMELQGVIEAVKFVLSKYPDSKVVICSDSQYVVGLAARKTKILAAGFLTRAGNEIQNADLVKALWEVQELMPVEYIKVAAHLKKTETINHNIEVDTIVRKLLRSAVSSNSSPKDFVSADV